MPVYRRSDSGRWCVLIRRKGFPHISSSFRLKDDADAFNDRVLAGMDRCRALGVPFDPNDYIAGSAAKPSGKNACMTLHQAIMKYAYEELDGLKGSRQAGLRLQMWDRSEFRDMRLCDIRADMIRDWKDNRRKSVGGEMVPVSASTLRNDLYRLSVLFDIAGRSPERGGWGIKGLLNPVRGMELETLAEKRSRRLRPGELERMIVALGNGRNADGMIALVRLTLATGMQKSEAMSITVGDLFRDRHGFHIRKNGRDIPISHSTMQDIQFLLHGKRSDQHLFTFTESQSDFAWRDAKRVAGCPDLRFLDIRNEAICRFVDAGMTVQDIMNMSGHKTSSVIMKYIENHHQSM